MTEVQEECRHQEREVCVEVVTTECQEVAEEACTQHTTQACDMEEKTACTIFPTQECRVSTQYPVNPGVMVMVTLGGGWGPGGPGGVRGERGGGVLQLRGEQLRGGGGGGVQGGDQDHLHPHQQDSGGCGGWKVR